MAGWRIPNPQSIKDPAERQRWLSLERWLQSPIFPQGILVGTVSDQGSADSSTGVYAQVPTVNLDSLTVLRAGGFLADAWIQSTNYDGTDVETGDATQGFRAQANGKSEWLGDMRVVGDITATRFATAEDFTIDGGIEIEGTAVKRMNFRRDGTLETHPSNIEAGSSFGGTYLGMSGPGADPPFVALRTDDTTSETIVAMYSPNGRADVESLGGDVNLTASGGQVKAQGVSVDTKPYARFGAPGASTPIPTGTPTLIFSNTVPGHVNNHNGAASVIYSAAGGGRYIPQVAGEYRIHVITGWTAGTYEPNIAIKVNGTPFDIGGGAVNRIAPRLDNSGYFEFNGTTDYFQIEVFHGGGAGINAVVHQLVVERVSA
jgi:hypothetical protein